MRKQTLSVLRSKPDKCLGGTEPSGFEAHALLGHAFNIPLYYILLLLYVLENKSKYDKIFVKNVLY